MGTESFDSNDFDLFLYQMPDDVLLENHYENNPEDVLNLQDLIEPSITELTQSGSSESPTLTTTTTTVVTATTTPITITATNDEPAIESYSLDHHLHHMHQESPPATVTNSTVTSTLTSPIPPIDSIGLTNTSYNQQSSYNYYYCPQGVWPYCLQYCQVHGMQVYPYFNPYVRCTRPGQQVYLSPPPPPPQPATPLAHQQAPPSVPVAGSSTTATSYYLLKVHVLIYSTS